jgi:hypothetical protein
MRIKELGTAPPKMDYAKSSIKPFGSGLMVYFPMLLWTNVYFSMYEVTTELS